jgi:hypothetical protein
MFDELNARRVVPGVGLSAFFTLKAVGGLNIVPSLSDLSEGDSHRRCKPAIQLMKRKVRP